MYSIYTSCS